MKNIKYDSDAIIRIAVDTWSFRITVSISHRAKVNLCNVGNLVDSLLNDTKTASMIYGTKTEKIALKILLHIHVKDYLSTGNNLIHIGLLTSLIQPWLACSPDGVVVCRKNI